MMASVFEPQHAAHTIAGQCECEGIPVAVSITRLDPEGCVLEAQQEWPGMADFLHLRIAGSIDMNGRLVWAQGGRAQMRFFGQIHPAAIAALEQAASR